MVRVAFTLIGGRLWTGGYNYLLNLGRVLSVHAHDRIEPVFFFGEDVPDEDVAPFAAIRGAKVVRDAYFDESRKRSRLINALVTGVDRIAADSFREKNVDVVFESAQFFGWRFPLPVVAWIPDFQHRHLRHLFGLGAYWRRELGFRAQVWGGRHIMLSSEDARDDCEKFYPSTLGRTHVVRFAVPTAEVDAVAARVVADHYGLPDSFFFLPNQFWVHKNHECVIRALHLIKKRGGDVVVVASGRPDDPRVPGHFQRLTRLVEELDVGEQFKMLGLIPYPHLSALMRICTALINPSFFEGWSTTVEEAKSLQTPMLLSSLPVHREQAVDCVKFFDPGSPEQLATELLEFPPAALTEDQNRCGATTAASAEMRVARFSDDFGRLMEHAAIQRSL